jgi:hypothetical protein
VGEPFLLGFDGFLKLVEVEEGGSLALITTGPGGVEFNTGLCILKSKF